MSDPFSRLQQSPVFKDMVALLDTSTWSKDTTTYTEKALTELAEHFKSLLVKNDCVMEKILLELSALRNYIIPIIENNNSKHYLDLWQKIFPYSSVTNGYKNILLILEIFLITPFTNAKVELGFSRMARVKTDFRNCLGRTRLDARLEVSEKGVELAEFKPDPAIDIWYSTKVRRVT